MDLAYEKGGLRVYEHADGVTVTTVYVERAYHRILAPIDYFELVEAPYRAALEILVDADIVAAGNEPFGDYEFEMPDDQVSVTVDPGGDYQWIVVSRSFWPAPPAEPTPEEPEGGV
jgi:hypothetical protein